MEDVLSQVLAWLAGVNPLYAGLALFVWMLFGDKIKDVLGRIKLPRPDPGPVVKPDPLEEHPLLDLLWKRLKKRFEEKAPDTDDEDLFVALARAIKDGK